MGTILEFRRNEEVAERLPRPVEGSLGEIIIFPGVRIDRRVSNYAPEETGAPSRKRSRKK